MLSAVFAVAATGVLLFLGTGRAELWYLAWIAAAPALRFAYRSPSGWAAFGVAFAGAGLGSLDLVLMYGGQFPAPALATWVAGGAALWGCAVLIARALARRLEPEAALFSYPLVAVAGDLLLRMAIARAVESGFALARSASHGLLTACDAYGRIVAQAPSAANELFAAGLPLGPGPTFYASRGDVFGYTALAAFILLVLGTRARTSARRERK